MTTRGEGVDDRRKMTEKLTGKLTIYFEEPFWVGVFERVENGRLSAAKVTFGAEPKDYEVYAFVLRHYAELCFGPSVAAEEKPKAMNPKRLRRKIQKQLSEHGTGTKSQQALQLGREQNKQERAQKSRDAKHLDERRQFALRQQRKKEKHKGH